MTDTGPETTAEAPLTADDALRQIMKWCDASRADIAAAHGSEERLLFAVIPNLCMATLAGAPKEVDPNG